MHRNLNNYVVKHSHGPEQKRTYQEHIPRVVEHLVTLLNFLSDFTGFKEPNIAFLRCNGSDRAQNVIQVSGEVVRRPESQH